MSSILSCVILRLINGFGVPHLRRRRELLRVVFVERASAGTRAPVGRAIASLRPLRPVRQLPDEVARVPRYPAE